MNNSKNYAHSDIRFSLCPLKWDFFFEIFSRIWSVYKKKLLYLQPNSHNRDSKSNPLKLFFMYYVKQVKLDQETAKPVTTVLLSTKEKSVAIGVCKQIAESVISYSKPPVHVSTRVLDGNSVVVAFDCFLSGKLSE